MNEADADLRIETAAGDWTPTAGGGGPKPLLAA
jgi:hypothetical protein